MKIPMMHDAWLALVTWLRRPQGARRALLTVLAGITLVGILVANLMLWPIEYLDFGVEPSVGNVAWVAPGGPAAQAGLQPGDRVLRMYGRPWPEVIVDPLSSTRDQPLIRASARSVTRKRLTVRGASRAGERRRGGKLLSRIHDCGGLIAQGRMRSALVVVRQIAPQADMGLSWSAVFSEIHLLILD